uniref:Complement component 4 binding protein alpha n=1 Tax=Spermophilus dauricus TaxID=99837 RepID=A0A8C9Q084_SPEDA
MCAHKRQAMCPPRPPSGTHHRKREMATWAFCNLRRVSDPILFQMTLVAALLVTVHGKCGPPPNLSFASPISAPNQTEFRTGYSLSYTCRPGYSKTSSSSQVSCAYTGKWNFDVFCVKKRCSNPGDLPNGRVEIKTDLAFGSQIEFSCSEGFVLKGPTTSYCEIQDKRVAWSNPFPVCLIVKCEPPPDISNGKHSGSDEDLFTYGSSVTYTCDPNFSLIGNASISCTVENKTVGVWSPSPPTCENINCPAPVVPHGIIISGFGPTYSYKDSIVFGCQKGFNLKGSSSIHCEANKKWNTSPPICEPMSHHQNCNFPPTIAHGHHKPSFHLYKTEIVYECDVGYQLVGEAKLSCSYSQWSPEPPQCKATCRKPEIKNGTLSVNKYQYLEMESITVHCDSGFKVVGSQMITCSEDTAWHPAVPKCEWEFQEGCNQVYTGKKLLQCLPNPADVKMALEISKLSLEIELLELQLNKERQTSIETPP